MTASFRSILSLASTFVAVTVAPAAPLESPLAVTPDRLGAELQQTFISAPPDVATKTRTVFVAYRKAFNLATVPKSAELHLFADARYILWLNGQPIHRGPNRFDIHGPQYDTVDVTAALRAGSNQIAIVVMGNGGVIDPKASDGGNNARMMKHEPGLTLRLDADGRPVVRTDTTWKWNDQTRYRPAHVDWAKIVDRIDTRVEDGDWTQPDYNDRAWKNSVKISGDLWGPLSVRRIALLRDTPVEATFADGATFPVTLTAGQELKFSTSRLVLAYTMIVFEADEGTELSFGYAGIDYVAKAGRQTYVSSDTCAFHGGAITVKSGKAKILGLKLVERLYPFDRVGGFKSNDEYLNRLWDLCARSLQILSEDSYVDCADRERAEWMDNDPPVFDITRTAMSAPGPDGKPRYGDARLLGEMLRRTALSVRPEGWVKAHTSSDRFDIHAHMEDRSCDWVQGARRYYESTGDKTIIREIWPVIVRQLDYFLARRTSRGLVLAREWVVWGNPIGYVTCEGTGLNAFVYKALVDAAHLGRIIGETRQADRFATEAKALATAVNTVLWNEELGTYYSGHYTEADRAKADKQARRMSLKVENDLIEPTLFPALWALDQEIVPADRRERVTAYLLANRGRSARIMTSYYLFKQLYAADTAAFDLDVLGTLRGRWKGQVNSGWGVTWEEFNGGSKAHCYGMFPGYFLSAYVLGVRPDLPASNQRIIIEPHLGDLTSVEGTVVTEFGPVPVTWTSNAGTLAFTVEVPAGVKALLRLPAGEVVLDGKPAAGKTEGRRLVVEAGPGKHQGTCRF